MAPENLYLLLEYPECNYDVQPQIRTEDGSVLDVQQEGWSERQVNMFPFKGQLYGLINPRYLGMF